MSDHRPVSIWQERGNEYTFACSCGMVWKHQQFGQFPVCDEQPVLLSFDSMGSPRYAHQLPPGEPSDER